MIIMILVVVVIVYLDLIHETYCMIKLYRSHHLSRSDDVYPPKYMFISPGIGYI